MGFILDGLDTESYDRSYTDRELVARILGYFRPHAGKMALVSLMLMLNSAAGSGMPILISKTIDAISMAPDLTATAFPPTTPDPAAALASRDRLVALAQQTGAYLLMGHNGEQWAALPKSPAPYRRPAM